MIAPRFKSSSTDLDSISWLSAQAMCWCSWWVERQRQPWPRRLWTAPGSLDAELKLESQPQSLFIIPVNHHHHNLQHQHHHQRKTLAVQTSTCDGCTCEARLFWPDSGRLGSGASSWLVHIIQVVTTYWVQNLSRGGLKGTTQISGQC